MTWYYFFDIVVSIYVLRYMTMICKELNFYSIWDDNEYKIYDSHHFLYIFSLLLVVEAAPEE